MKIKKHFQTIHGNTITTYLCEKDQGFSDCLFVLTGNEVVIKTENITTKKLEFILLAVKEIAVREKLKLNGHRFSFLQFGEALTNWSKVQEQHVILKKLFNQNNHLKKYVHLNLPLETISSNADQSILTKRTAENLITRFNSEGWLVYCRWLASEIKDCLLTFKPDALDEYRLQARLEDYLHEIESPLLHAVELALHDAFRQQEFLSSHEDYDQFFTLEKIIVAAQGKIRIHIENLWRLLKNISEEINHIEKAHPELHSLKIISHLLHLALSHQIDKDMGNSLGLVFLLQLLNQRMGVISVINGSADEQTNKIFSAALAIAELSQKLSLDKLIKICEEWTDDNVQEPEAKVLHEIIVANCKQLF